MFYLLKKITQIVFHFCMSVFVHHDNDYDLPSHYNRKFLITEHGIGIEGPKAGGL